MEAAISEAKNKKALWTIYLITRWYVWCAEAFPEIGFDIDYAHELDGLIIPGSPKGEAVRVNDPDDGPLDRTVELPLLLRALSEDTCQDYESIEQRAALALCIAFGRNPACFAYLEANDIRNVADGLANVPPAYMIDLPRIKKRQLHPRDEIRTEPMEHRLAKYVVDLKKQCMSEVVTVATFDGPTNVSFQPLFRHPRGRTLLVHDDVVDRAARVQSGRISALVQSFAQRNRVVSPLTHEIMRVTPRRLRYTLACGLVEEGISRKELARLLDHSDTQHVRVYFDLKSNVVRRLDAAAAKSFAPLMSFFRGTVIDPETGNDSTNASEIAYADPSEPGTLSQVGLCGQKKLCHLDPPFSCYLCEKFRPYRTVDHERVLTSMLSERERVLEKLDDQRLGVQLDDVIFAVAEVCRIVEEARD
ncbi:tyrosine-type recombinase/integrase [Cognatilysobacter bugurensis]|nr:tyrosine-type recombinase/integrase [Lysobacter bugurensis]